MAKLAATIIAFLFAASCASEEKLNIRSLAKEKASTDQLIDRTVQSDTGQIGPVPFGLVGGIWETGTCDSIYKTGSVRTTQTEFKASGLGELAVAVGTDAQLDLQIDFSLCEPSYYARAIVFVVDTSESMRSVYNTGTDPLKNETCGRLEAIRTFLAALPPKNHVRVGFVTFSTGVDKDSSTLLSTSEFSSNYLNANSLCHVRLGQSGIDTNYTSGLERAEAMLNNLNDEVASQEVYLITDGMPASTTTDGRATAARLRARGLVGTLLLGTNDAFLKSYISSKRPNGDPVHSLAKDAGSLSAALADTVSSRTKGGSFSYKSEDVDDWVKFPLDPELTFFHANGVIRADYTGSLMIKINDYDENGVERRREGTLDIIRRDP